jgi:hypothetical protein
MERFWQSCAPTITTRKEPVIMDTPIEPPDDPSVNEDPPDETTSSNEEAAPSAIVEFSSADFEAMLGSYQDLALHVVLGDDDDHHRPRARVGRYERRDG